MPTGVRVVDVDNKPVEVARQIQEAELLFTSSLHGLIFAHALGRPCVLIRPLTEEPEIKYQDYLAAVGLPWPGWRTLDEARRSPSPVSPVDLAYGPDDFALPRLQDRFGPLAGSMVLGPFWALWHFPLFLSDWGGWPDASWTRPVAFTVFCLAFNLVMTWVFNRTGQSLPLAVLAHVSVNNFASVIWGSTFPTIDADRAMVAMASGAVVAATAVVIATRGRLGYPGRP